MNNSYNNKKYYWMKMDRNFFKDARIKKLRRIAGGDTFTIIYLELLLLSLEKNGLLIYEGIENSFEEEMASKIDEFNNLDNVKITIAWLINEGILVPQQDGDHQFKKINVGSETQSNIYKKDKKNKQLEKFQQLSNESWKNSIEIDKEKEIDKEIEKEEEEDKEEEKIFIIVKIFNEHSGLHPIEKLTEARKEKIISLLRDYGIKEICRAIEICSKSQWLLKQKDWYANFDWFFKQDNFVKVLEGKFLEEKQRKDDKRLTKDVPDWYQEYEDKIKESSNIVVSEEEKAKALEEVLASNLFECSKVKEEGN